MRPLVRAVHLERATALKEDLGPRNARPTRVPERILALKICGAPLSRERERLVPEICNITRLEEVPKP